MASIQYRKVKGKKYWSIVESRRIKGKPRTVILEYLGSAGSLLKKLKSDNDVSIKTYAHGDIIALINAAIELDIINIINKYVKTNRIREGITVGTSLLLAAIGRASQPTSKRGWYDWCKNTSLEYILKKSFKKLTSQHFWYQMNDLSCEHIPFIEEDILKKLKSIYNLELDCLFFDTTNFFTFINSMNDRCKIAKRGKNKQKRSDLRQIGLALLVSKKEQFPLFHQTYEGNQNDITTFKNIFEDLLTRLKNLKNEISNITIVFDKGNNSKDNFKKLDHKDCYYIAKLSSIHFKDLIKEANKKFSTIQIQGEDAFVYRDKRKIWGKERTCIVTISSQLTEGQINGIYQSIKSKHKKLKALQAQLENPRKRKNLEVEEIEKRIKKIIKGQFVEDILKYEIFTKRKNNTFIYYIDNDSFEKLKKEVIGRQILITNRHDWKTEDIILSYKGQSKIEYAFRTVKNPFHLAIRPQFHWTDQKIKVHFFICIIAYLLSIFIYRKAKKVGYKKNINNLMNDLQNIRLACIVNRNKVKYQLENIPENLKAVCKELSISNETIKPKINLSDYK